MSGEGCRGMNCGGWRCELGGQHTMPSADDVLQNCGPET